MAPVIEAPPTSAVCIHCGSAFRPTTHRPDFCCAGCQFVHDLIIKNGFAKFYELQDTGIQPVKSVVFQQRDLTWLSSLVTTAEAASDPVCELELGVQGISCIGCVWLIENVGSHLPGVLDLRVDPALGRCDLRWRRGDCDVPGLARQLQSFGYLLGPRGEKAATANRALTIRLGVCAALAMNTMLFTLPGYLGMESSFEFAALFDKLTLLFSTLSFVVGGSYFFGRSWHSLRQGMLHIDLPISLGLIAAYAGSVFAWARGATAFQYFDFVSIFVFLMLVGRWLQQKAVERNRNRLLESHGEMPPVEEVETGEKLPVASLTRGVKFLVAPGQAIPVRSRLHSEAAALGLEWINGESEATTARRGRVVSSGAINCGQHPIELEALEPWSHSLLFRLLKSVPGGPHRHTALERFIRGYLSVVLVVGGAGFLGWWLATGDLLRSLQVLISVLVVSCPCASGVALPLADDLAAGALRKIGVFVRNASLWARLDRVKKILFDKTGTLTLETIALRNPEALAALHPEEKRVLLALVNHNLHPVSCCLREALLAEGVGEMTTPAPDEHIGIGLELRIDHDLWRLGRAGWAGTGHGDGLFSRNGTVLAEFRFGDDLRSDAADEVHALERRGCEVFILSGDRQAKVKALSHRLNLRATHCVAELTPEQKAEWVTAHDAHDTLLIGDGANDSLAFNSAWCTGTPAVDRGLLEHKADFYFLGRNLGGIRALLETADARRRTVRRVIGFAIAYNTVAIALCLTGHMSPLLAAVLMPASSLVSLAIVVSSLQTSGRRR
ncbi:MAG: heavy metal translocating P-type ATPase metal-binding domain-containing protein [Chthoniobacteraceae bacterium]